MFYVTMLSCTNMVVYTKICTTEKIPAIIMVIIGHFLVHFTPHRVEGVFYRIGQKLEWYRLEPVAHTIDDHNYCQF